MTLIIREDEVSRLLTMQDTLDAVEGSFRSQGEGTSVNRPRRRFHIPGRGNMQLMSGVCYYREAMGLKVYTAFRTGTRFMVLLFSAETGDLLAIVQADHLGRMRTGAASGVATKYLAKESAKTVGMIGSGGQAATQLEAVCAVRNNRVGQGLQPPPRSPGRLLYRHVRKTWHRHLPCTLPRGSNHWRRRHRHHYQLP